MDRPKRMANYELLRIVTMFMVVCLHYQARAGVLTAAGVPAGYVQIVGNLIESFCIICVNLYVLISGYFLSSSEFRVSRILKLLCEILFYALLIPAVLKAMGIQVTGGENIWRTWFYIFPVSMEQYWFISAYVFMVLLSPFFNEGIRWLTRKQLKALILVLLFFTCILPSISPVQLTDDHAGYNAMWFFMVYLVAGYMRKYGLPRLGSPRRALACWLGSTFLMWGWSLILHRITLSGALLYYSGVPFHLNSFFCLTGAMGLFACFGFIRIPEGGAAKLIRSTAPLTLGVYLIHENIDIRDRWVTTLCKLYGPIPQNGMVFLHMFACVATIYILSLFIDLIRTLLFDWIGIRLSGTRLAALLQKADQKE